MQATKLYTLKKSSIHHKGLFAKTNIKKETPIIQYVGKAITQDQADNRALADKHACIYLFELSDDCVIDGDTDYNIAKYINHSCDPNCYTTIIDDEIWIIALRDIRKGEELSYDYGFQRLGWEEHPCRCGAANCFGFIVGRKFWSSIRTTKRYQKLMSENKGRK